MNIEGLSQIPQEAAVSAGFPKGRAFPACLHAPGFFHGVPGRLIRVKVLSLLASAALLAAAGSAPAAESVAAGADPDACAECDDDDEYLSPEELYKSGLEGLSGKSETMTCEGGLSLLMESAADGYAQAQAALGNAYYDGNCTERNYAEAVKWWQKAAEQGNADAEYRLGTAYTFGNGVGIDFRKALLWYRKAAAQGDTRAMSAIGDAYGTGNGVEQDGKEALRWYKTACSAGSKPACGFAESINPETGNLRYFEDRK